MTVLYISQNLSDVEKRLGKGMSCVALVDELDGHLLPSLKGRVFVVSEVEKKMFERVENARTLDKDITDWFKRWPNIPVLEGKSLKEQLEYRGTSLWWFGETVIFRDSIGKYVSLKEILTRLEVLKYFITKYGVKKILTLGKEVLTIRCARTLSKTLEIPLLSHNPGQFSNKADILYPEIIYRFKQIRTIARHFVAKLNNSQSDDLIRQKAPILGMSYIRHYLESDISIMLEEVKEPTELPKDMMLYPVLKSILTNHGVKSKVMYIDKRYIFQFGTIKDMTKLSFPLDLYVTIIDINLWKHRKRLKKIWKRLEGSKEFQNSLTFRDVQLWSLLKDYFAFLFIKQFPEAIECVRTMDSMLRAENPKVVIISDETGLYGRALVLTARDKNVKTLGLQHANIAFLELEHYHLGEGEELRCPIPDITATGGNNDSKILLKSGIYNNNNVIVTGRVRYDNLAHMNDYYDKENVRKRYSVGSNKLVLLTTVRYPVIKDREVWLLAMVKASKKIKNAFFLVKPHPSEDTRMHKRIIKSFGGKNIKLVNEKADTKELLFACDVAVNAGSTVGLEAILMGKPFIMVNLTGRADLMPYAEKKAAIPVREESQIILELTKVLNGEYPSYLEAGTKEFIEDHTYKVDGKSSLRVGNQIMKLSKE